MRSTRRSSRRRWRCVAVPIPPARRIENARRGKEGKEFAHPRLARPSAPSPDPSLPRVSPHPQEFSAALSGLDKELHEPLYDLYCQLLQGISTFSLDEFEAIVREEALVPRLNALDQACEARGIMELGARADGGVAPLARPPDAVMRALRADVKKRELASMRTKLEDAEKAATEARARLHARSAEARTMAAGLRAGAAELQGVHKSSLQWAGRAPTFPPGAGEGPATAPPPTAHP